MSSLFYTMPSQDLLTTLLLCRGALPGVSGTSGDGYRIDLGDGTEIPWDPAQDLDQAFVWGRRAFALRGWTLELLLRPEGHAYINDGAWSASQLGYPYLRVLWGAHRACQGITTGSHALLVLAALAQDAMDDAQGRNRR